MWNDLVRKDTFPKAFGIAMLLFVLALTALGCGSDQREKNASDSPEKTEMPARDINAVLADHDDDLLKLASVVGVAVGELDNHTPCLLIMLSEDNMTTRAKIPATLEGHPTKIVISGEIKPL